MGGGASSPNKNARYGVGANELPSRADPSQRALPILATDSVEGSLSMSVNINSMRRTELDDESRDLLVEAFGDFFMLSGDDYNSLRTKLLLQACKRESSPANAILMREGEVGSKMYVIQSGHLEVSIDGVVVRHVQSGSLIGEISLLYDAPRSATVKCITACTFFVLTRDSFKQIQGIASSASLLRRSRWLQACADALSLGVVDISRLAGALETQMFSKGEKVYAEGEYSNKVFLFEEGSAILAASDGSLNPLPVAEIHKYCGVMTPSAGKKTLFSPKGLAKLPEMEEDEYITSDMVVGALEVVVEDSSKSMSLEEDLVDPFGIFEGYILCLNLVSSGDPTLPQKFALKPKKRIGSKIPFSVTVTSDKLQCSYFTIDIFNQMFGCQVQSDHSSPIVGDNSFDKNYPLSTASISSNGSELNRLNFLSEETDLVGASWKKTDSVASRRNRGGSRLDDGKPKKTIAFSDEAFKDLCLLGKGSYGEVTFSKEVVSGEYYAIKRVYKGDVTSSQHLRHIYDECKLLLMMKSPFIVNLQGIYMTPDDIVLVMEPALHGDLWGVIYEVKKHSRGIPTDLIRFYTASLVFGLDHIHKQGIAFRDLKPENIMLDDKGYLTIIDFGFAKKIPFVSVENGVRNVKLKSYTLCGTPDYLAPEFIFNSGVTRAADLWALGVILHEMIMLATPFRPARKSDLTALFVNIASVKKIGLNLSSNIDYRTGDIHAKQLISQLLRADPNERIGAMDCIKKILEAPLFDDLNISALLKRSIVPSFIPNPSIEIEAVKSEKTRYMRDKKVNKEPNDKKWEPFEALFATVQN